MSKQVVVIAGPAGSGKDALARRMIEKYPTTTLMVTATTRPKRPGEADGVNYHFLTNDTFLEELDAGNILEYYHRADTDTYYGIYKPDLEARLATGKIVLAIVQIVGAKYLKERYGATTIFILPPGPESLERRIKSRGGVSDVEWQERMRYMEEEMREQSGWYDYHITNEDHKLEEAVEVTAEILRKEGYVI